MSSSGKPKSGSPPDWGLGEGLTPANLEDRARYKLLHRGFDQIVNVVMSLQIANNAGNFLNM